MFPFFLTSVIAAVFAGINPKSIKIDYLVYIHAEVTPLVFQESKKS